MSLRTVVVLDVDTVSGERRLLETVQGTGMGVEEVDSIETFVSALRSKRARVGVIAFELLWPDPQKALRAVRDKAPGARLVVAHADSPSRVSVGQRLWSVGLCDYFVPRSSPPHELTPVLRQAYADALIESSLDASGVEDDPSMSRFYGRMRFLHHLNAALTNQRRVDGLVRELQMKLPQLLDYTVLAVLIVTPSASNLFVFQTRPVEHQVVWKLAEDVCGAVAPFSEHVLTPEALTFIECAPTNRTEDGDPKAASNGGGEGIAIPMVFCGELVGGIGVLAGATEVNAEHRAILQLVAYQLAASVRNAHALEAAESDSLVDELTGTSNRRFLRRALTAEWRRAQRYRKALSFVMLDIDHFKRVNDVHGHLVGDGVLHAFAAIVREQLRDTDHVVRYGGEEFLLILPETSLRDATLVVERIRLVLTRTPVFVSEKTGSIQITISAGVAGFPTSAVGSAEELIHLADEALLHAKRSGRDRVCLASGQSFDSLGLEQDTPGMEKRRFSRVRSQLPVRFVALPEFDARASTMSATDLSEGGVAVAGPRDSLNQNAYALVYIGDEQNPRLTQVKWTRDGARSERSAGLQFVGADELGPPGPPGHPRRRALVIAKDPQTRATVHRVISAAAYDVEILPTVADLPDQLEGYSLLVLGESVLRGELGERLQNLRQHGGVPLRIAVINETLDRRRALDTILAHQADHLLSSGSSEDTLFATVSKLLLEEYFGLKKYLMWGAETRSWSLSRSDEKTEVLDGVQAMAAHVRCHPRIIDLLVSAVDEMIINAIYRPEPVDAVTGRSRRPVTVECGSDGRFLGVAVIDEHGLFCHDDLFRGIGKALEHEQKGIAETSTHANLGFRIMLTTLSHLVINVDPGRRTEVIGLVDLRKSLKEYRTAVPSLGMFTSERPT